jgi:hypothetical protein
MPLPKYPTAPERMTEELRVLHKPSEIEALKAHADKAGLRLAVFVRGVLREAGLHTHPSEDGDAQDAAQAV